jgi:hypothetical protein
MAVNTLFEFLYLEPIIPAIGLDWLMQDAGRIALLKKEPMFLFFPCLSG